MKQNKMFVIQPEIAARAINEHKNERVNGVDFYNSNSLLTFDFETINPFR